MAKKAESVNMVDRFAEFKEYKNIDKATMISVLEESFRNVLAKMFGYIRGWRPERMCWWKNSLPGSFPMRILKEFMLIFRDK